MATSHSLYELDVRLREIEPPIWRTVEVAGSATLEDVHYAIQLAMGWTNSHLHHFKIGKQTFGMVSAEEFEPIEDECEHTLAKVAAKGDTFLYEYDFGDGWEHDVTVKRVVAATKPVRPRCVAGARACPPEDCGGPHGYAQLLVALADPKHEDHLMLAEWAPADFDATRFTPSKKDLTRDIDELRELANESIDDGAVEGGYAALPRPLVEAALDLPPFERASLVAILSASLAEQLTTAMDLLEQSNRALTNRSRKQASGRRRTATNRPRARS